MHDMHPSFCLVNVTVILILIRELSVLEASKWSKMKALWHPIVFLNLDHSCNKYCDLIGQCKVSISHINL